MSELKQTPEVRRPRQERSADNTGIKTSKKKKKRSGSVARFFRRLALFVLTLAILAAGALAWVLNVVFNGPSEAARDVLTMSLSEASATKWVPGLFLGNELVEEIRNKAGQALQEDVSDASQVIISKDNALTDSDEWKDHPDGIRIMDYAGGTYNAHIMIIRDPAMVYMATSTDGAFSTSVPGTRINEEIETEGAIAAINAGAFNDDGTANSYVGSIPAGLLMVNGEVKSNKFHNLVPEEGFAGFNQDGVLIVATDMTAAEAEVQGIRDGCSFGPVLIVNGEVNADVYNTNSGYASRTAIGQRTDGTVIFVTIDGLQAGSLGANYQDLIDILMEYGAVNACSMNGSSSVMMYRDAGQIRMINNQSLLNTQESSMPNYWMVRATGKE